MCATINTCRACNFGQGLIMIYSMYHGYLSFYTETLLYVVSPYDYYYYVKTLTTYFRHLEFKIGFDLFLNLDLAKFLCIIISTLVSRKWFENRLLYSWREQIHVKILLVFVKSYENERPKICRIQNYRFCSITFHSQFFCGGKWTLLYSKILILYKSKLLAKWKDTDLSWSAIKIVGKLAKKVPATSIYRSEIFHF